MDVKMVKNNDENKKKRMNPIFENRALTHGMIKTWKSCKEKLRLAYILLWKPRTFHFPFVTGEGVHEGLGELMKYKDVDRAIEHAEKNMDSQAKKFVEENGSMSAEMDQEFYTQCVYVQAMIENYAIFNRAFIKNVVVLARERVIPAREPVDETNFIHTAKDDAVIRYNGKRYLYEFKTAKSLILDQLMQHLPQLSGYYIRTSERYKLDGVYLDAIQKPMIKMTKNEDREQFLRRLELYYASPDKYFYEIFTLSKRHLEDYQNMIIDTAGEIEKTQREYGIGNTWPRNRYNCRVYGSCEFLPICDYGFNAINQSKFIKKSSQNEELE
jgi:hypothetical protein